MISRIKLDNLSEKKLDQVVQLLRFSGEDEAQISNEVTDILRQIKKEENKKKPFSHSPKSLGKAQQKIYWV